MTIFVILVVVLLAVIIGLAFGRNKPKKADPEKAKPESACDWMSAEMSYRQGSSLILEIEIFDVVKNPVTNVAFEFRERQGFSWISGAEDKVKTMLKCDESSTEALLTPRQPSLVVTASKEVNTGTAAKLLVRQMNEPHNRLQIGVHFKDGSVKAFDRTNIQIKSRDGDYDELEVGEAIDTANQLHF